MWYFFKRIADLLLLALLALCFGRSWWSGSIGNWIRSRWFIGCWSADRSILNRTIGIGDCRCQRRNIRSRCWKRRRTFLNWRLFLQILFWSGSWVICGRGVLSVISSFRKSTFLTAIQIRRVLVVVGIKGSMLGLAFFNTIHLLLRHAKEFLDRLGIDLLNSTWMTGSIVGTWMLNIPAFGRWHDSDTIVGLFVWINNFAGLSRLINWFRLLIIDNRLLIVDGLLRLLRRNRCLFLKKLLG